MCYECIIIKKKSNLCFRNTKIPFKMFILKCFFFFMFCNNRKTRSSLIFQSRIKLFYFFLIPKGQFPVEKLFSVLLLFNLKYTCGHLVKHYFNSEFLCVLEIHKHVCIILPFRLITFWHLYGSCTVIVNLCVFK